MRLDASMRMMRLLMKCLKPHLERMRIMTEFPAGLNRVFPGNRCWSLRSLIFWSLIHKSETDYS